MVCRLIYLLSFLKTITQKFIWGLEGDEKEFLYELCGGDGNLNFDDFEENFSKIEDAYNSLIEYSKFITLSVGRTILARFKLPNPELEKHERIIKSIYHKYVFQILGLIHRKVTKRMFKID